MHFKKIIKILTISVLFTGIITSCFSRQNYQRDKNIVDEKLFRTDQIPKDSLSTGNLSWKEIFRDAVLQKHISKALENNLDIRMALQNINAAEAYLKQAKSAYFPTISAGPGYTFQTPSLNTLSGQNSTERRYVNQYDVTGTLSWEADIFGKLKSQEKSQLAAYLGTVAAHQAVKSDIVSAVASAYYQLLMYDEQRNVLEKTIKIREKNLETTKALKEAGILTEVAVQQSQALVYNAKSSIVTIDMQIKILENAMSFLLGENPQKIERTTLNSQQLPQHFDLGYPTNLLSNRPDVKVAEQNLISAFELTNYTKSQFYPSLRINGNTGLQAINLDQLFSANSLFASVVGGLAQPIFNKRQIKSQYKISIANKEKAYLNFRKVMLNAGREVSNAMNFYQSQDAFISLKQKELDAYQKSVDYSQELVNYGMANYLEVLNASVNQLNAELNIVNAKYTKLNSGVELYRALGGGWR